MKNVVIYSSDGCRYCTIAKDFFRSKDIEYTEYNVSKDAEAKKFLMSKKIMGVPFIMIDDIEIRGFDKDKITEALGE